MAIWHVKVRKTRNAVAIWQGPQNLLPEARLIYRTASFWLSVGSPPMTDLAVATWQGPQNLLPEARLIYRTASFWFSVGSPP